MPKVPHHPCAWCSMFLCTPSLSFLEGICIRCLVSLAFFCRVSLTPSNSTSTPMCAGTHACPHTHTHATHIRTSNLRSGERKRVFVVVRSAQKSWNHSESHHWVSCGIFSNGAPPPNQFPFNWNQFHGGGVILILSIFSGGGRGGGGGWRALSFDISILSRGQINFQPTPIFVNKNSSFALPELAFVIWQHAPKNVWKSLQNNNPKIKLIKGSLEDTSKLRRVEERCDWKGEGSRGDVN